VLFNKKRLFRPPARPSWRCWLTPGIFRQDGTHHERNHPHVQQWPHVSARPHAIRGPAFLCLPHSHVCPSLFPSHLLFLPTLEYFGALECKYCVPMTANMRSAALSCLTLVVNTQGSHSNKFMPRKWKVRSKPFLWQGLGSMHDIKQYNKFYDCGYKLHAAPLFRCRVQDAVHGVARKAIVFHFTVPGQLLDALGVHWIVLPSFNWQRSCFK
jgi:hypothetical protein